MPLAYLRYVSAGFFQLKQLKRVF